MLLTISLGPKKEIEKENALSEDEKDLHPPQESVKWLRNVDLNSKRIHFLIEGSK